MRSVSDFPVLTFLVCTVEHTPKNTPTRLILLPKERGAEPDG